jgi:dihydroxy-acid dehydratase
LAARRAAWNAPEPHYASGVMAKYAYLVAQADDGAITNRVHLVRQPASVSVSAD